MAQRIAAAIAGNRALVTEAGTGTGKTFAYLVPALPDYGARCNHVRRVEWYRDVRRRGSAA